MYTPRPYLSLVLLLILTITNSEIKAATERHIIENQQIRMVIIPRSPQQMAAFYEGREFPRNAINETRNACFFTIGIQNKTKDILWLDTQQWQLSTESKQISLIDKSQWVQYWKKINLPQRFQSTFRWTLLPHQLDFQPGEREGGNITILRQDMPFNLTAQFNTGANKQGKIVSLKFKSLRCAQDKTE